MQLTKRTFAFLLAVALTLVLASCKPPSPDPAPKTGPAGAVETLLELRSKNSADLSAYTSVVSTEVAQAIVADASSRVATRSPLPAWNPARVVQEETSTAVVEVRWKPSSAFEGWPSVTTFVVEKNDAGKWTITEASEQSQEASATAP